MARRKRICGSVSVNVDVDVDDVLSEMDVDDIRQEAINRGILPVSASASKATADDLERRLEFEDLAGEIRRAASDRDMLHIDVLLKRLTEMVCGPPPATLGLTGSIPEQHAPH
jgi:hypothetical protein